MSLPKAYDPSQHEADIYALWESKKAFLPSHRGNNDSFSIVIPPPNANGNLHIGHAMTLAVEDIAIRYQRMLGKSVLFLPGADHAGFETQSVYEKQLAKAGKSRFDFSREELYSQIWDFTSETKTRYEQQFRRIGASLDWSRFTYTLDKNIIDRSYETFKKMWDEGLIYRGERLVNYCTYHGTGFADIEVEHREIDGHIWSLRYPLTDGSGEVVVATTRPETMLGDVAVAVHPDDARYKKILGKTVKLPLSGREVPILADDFVEKDFGTGAVKITPAHDVNDFEVAERHDLPMITVIGHDGKINHHGPKQYQGLTVKEARTKIVADLDAEGSLVEVKKHVNNVGHCYKCGTVIEPLLKEQWFIDMQPLAKPAIKALKDNKITFYPDSKRAQLIRYLEGLRDWNISRQIAWGIPIPAFQNVEDHQDWIFDARVDQEEIEVDHKAYRRDPDVFDTWFSSSSWPYATLNYPDDQDFKDFYPLSLMETGGEILYPWVSRMLMLGLYVTGEIPFKEVYIHGYVMAEDGSKMSKSVGNVVDPLPVIEQYGSDALRMGIVAGRSPAVNRGYDSRRVEEARNFANKLWNVSRYIQGTLDNYTGSGAEPSPKTPADHWILGRLSTATTSLGEHLDKYRFSEGYELVYHLIWDDIADWYIEASKSAQNTSVLQYVLETALKLAHPFAPFVTEAIWQSLQTNEDILATSRWPKIVAHNKQKSDDFETVKSIVTEVRQIKTLLGAHGGELQNNSSRVITDNHELVLGLAKLKKVSPNPELLGIKLTQTNEKASLLLDKDTTDIYLKKLEQRDTDVRRQIKTLQSRLDNTGYIAKAPKALIDESRAQLVSLSEELESIQAQIRQYSSL